MTLEMYERNLSRANKQVTEAAKKLSGTHTLRAITPHEEDDLLTEMTEAIRLVRQARRDLSVAKSTLQTEVYVRAAQEMSNE